MHTQKFDKRKRFINHTFPVNTLFHVVWLRDISAASQNQTWHMAHLINLMHNENGKLIPFVHFVLQAT